MYNTDLPARAELPSAGKLLRSTIIAALVAACLLVTTILPAEYGIDPTGIGRVLGLTRMGEIKASLARETGAEKPSSATAVSENPPGIQAPADAATPEMTKPSETDVKQAAPAQHTMTVRLKPGQAAEIKLAMRKGASVRYEWSTAGGGVNFDTHGDPVGAPKNFYHGYGKGRNSLADSGVLEAAFDGTHGWFWRNRSNAEVTVTLKTSGDYTNIKRVL
jgi:hypothetical protein